MEQPHPATNRVIGNWNSQKRPDSPQGERTLWNQSLTRKLTLALTITVSGVKICNIVEITATGNPSPVAVHVSISQRSKTTSVQENITIHHRMQLWNRNNPKLQTVIRSNVEIWNFDAFWCDNYVLEGTRILVWWWSWGSALYFDRCCAQNAEHLMKYNNHPH